MSQDRLQAYRDAQMAVDMHDRGARHAQEEERAGNMMRRRALEARVEVALAALNDAELEVLVAEYTDAARVRGAH
jgi:hypothetical protein